MSARDGVKRAMKSEVVLIKIPTEKDTDVGGGAAAARNDVAFWTKYFKVTQTSVAPTPRKWSKWIFTHLQSELPHRYILNS